MKRAPLLMNVVSSLVVHPEKSKPMLCHVASMFLKKRNKSLALVQRCIYVFLYGNACSNQVRLHAGSVTLTVFQLIFPIYTHAGVQMLAATYALPISSRHFECH